MTKKTKIRIISIATFAMFLISLLTVFPTGQFSKKTKYQKISEDIANIALNGVGQSSFPYVVIEPKTEKFKSPTNYIYMFRQIFSAEYTHYVATKNANKENDYSFSFNSSNITFIYSDGEIIDNPFNDYYKHRYYNMELLYNTHPQYDETKYKSVYLTEEDAYKLLVSKGIENPTRDDLYSKLVFAENEEDRVVDIITPDATKKYVVTNIIINENNYSFYNDIHNTFGTFVFLGDDALDDINEPQQFCFMFDKYDYHNKFIYEYIVDNYANDNYSIKFGTNNLKEGFDPSFIVESMYKKEYNNVPYIISAVLIFVFLIGYIVTSFFFNGLIKKKILAISLAASSLLPYLVFKIIYLATKNILLFSTISLVTYLIAIMILFIATFLSILIGRIKHENQD